MIVSLFVLSVLILSFHLFTFNTYNGVSLWKRFLSRSIHNIIMSSLQETSLVDERELIYQIIATDARPLRLRDIRKRILALVVERNESLDTVPSIEAISRQVRELLHQGQIYRVGTQYESAS